MRVCIPRSVERSGRSPEQVARVMHKVLAALDEHEQNKEHFWTVMLNSKNTITHIDLCSIGTVNCSIVHPREVFGPALRQGATNIIVCHNHPTGNARPSREDILIAKRFEKCGRILGVECVDHVIIGNPLAVDATSKMPFASLKEGGYL